MSKHDPLTFFLDLNTVKKHFNQFFAEDKKLFGESSFDRWLFHTDWRHRLFGINKTDYRALTGKQKNEARKNAKLQFEERFHYIFQRRNDCIHNCDRVKVSLNKRHIDNKGYVSNVLDDICFLVARFTEELQSEFPNYIARQNYNSTTRARVTQ
jgi:hypothetical protein